MTYEKQRQEKKKIAWLKRKKDEVLLYKISKTKNKT